MTAVENDNCSNGTAILLGEKQTTSGKSMWKKPYFPFFRLDKKYAALTAINIPIINVLRDVSSTIFNVI